MAYPTQYKHVSGKRQRRRKQIKAALRLAAILIGVLCTLFLVARLRRPNRAASPLVLPPYTRVYMAPPAATPVARPPAGSTDIRTEFVTVATRADDTVCAHWISSALSGMQTTATGWGETDAFRSIDKLSHLSQVIALKEMRDWDVLVYLDNTILFTGMDMQPFIDDFISRSPSHPDDVDVRAIREGTKAAPVRFATDPSCVAKETLGNTTSCESSYFNLDAAVERRAVQDSFQYLRHVNVTHYRTGAPFLYSGFFMARVWALKELVAAQKLFTSTLPAPGTLHKTDQAVFTALYLDLRWEELSLGLLAPKNPQATHPTVNQFGLHYGLLDLWHSHPPLSLIHHSGTPDTRIDASLYGFPFQEPTYPCAIRPSTPEVTIRGILNSVASPAQYVHDVPVRYSHPKGIKTVPLAPPLISQNPRLIDRTPEGDFRSTFPSLVEVPIMEFGYCRPEVAQFLGWYLVLDLKSGQRALSAELAKTAQVEVVNAATGTLTQVGLGDTCRAWIDSNIVKGPLSY